MSVTLIDRMIDLFENHRTSFGLDGEGFLDDQCEFETRFCHLICEYRGHDIVPDQCMKPEHDYCCVCNELKTDLDEKVINELDRNLGVQVSVEEGLLYFRYDFPSCSSDDEVTPDDYRYDITEDLRQYGWEPVDAYLEHDCYSGTLKRIGV